MLEVTVELLEGPDVFISVLVLMSGQVEELEAEEFSLEPGSPRDTRMVEVELERLLGPYSHDTRLVIKRLRDDKREEVPNYGGMFDFWRLDENLLERSWDKFIALDIQYLIYADLWADDEDDEEDADALKGYPVFRASEIPLDSPHDGIVTPDGRYHDFWTGENKENRELAERLIKEHGDCLAVLCSAHV